MLGGLWVERKPVSDKVGAAFTQATPARTQSTAGPPAPVRGARLPGGLPSVPSPSSPPPCLPLKSSRYRRLHGPSVSGPLGPAGLPAAREARRPRVSLQFPVWRTSHTVKWEGVWRELGCLARTASFAVRKESGHSLKSSLSVRPLLVRGGPGVSRRSHRDGLRSVTDRVPRSLTRAAWSFREFRDTTSCPFS